MDRSDELPLFQSAPLNTTSLTSNFPNDPWLASSVLQKAIRRGDADTAANAGVTLHRLRGSSIWRRLLVIAFEDIGAASPGALINAVKACTDPVWRKQAGGNTAVVSSVVRMLADAPKDRSSDYLICCARSHSSLAGVRQRLESMPVHARVDMAADTTLPVTVRATAAWYASGVEWGQEQRVGQGDLESLLKAFQDIGAPVALLEATKIAARRTREPITIMVPLVWLAADADRHKHVVDQPVPASPVVGGVPLHGLDMHTRIGRRAIELFAKEDDAVSRCLDQHVPVRSRREAAYLSAFYADAAPLSRRLQWFQADAIEKLGIENDFLSVGVTPDAVPALLGAVSENLDHLNAIRTRVLTAALRADSTGANA